jgi:hypothetical protein
MIVKTSNATKTSASFIYINKKFDIGHKKVSNKQEWVYLVFTHL